MINSFEIMTTSIIQKMMGFVCEILSVHKVLPAEVSAQLRFLASKDGDG